MHCLLPGLSSLDLDLISSSSCLKVHFLDISPKRLASQWTAVMTVNRKLLLMRKESRCSSCQQRIIQTPLTGEQFRQRRPILAIALTTLRSLDPLKMQSRCSLTPGLVLSTILHAGRPMAHLRPRQTLASCGLLIQQDVVCGKLILRNVSSRRT